MLSETFSAFVKERLNSSRVFYSGNKAVNKIYIVGGDGKDLIPNAIDCGADTLLTGRASYNTMIDSIDMGLNIVEAGHFYTEDPVCITLENIVNSLDNNIKVYTYKSNNIIAIN